MTQLVITAVGPDKPGLVGELTSHLHAAGANILDSRMVNLRGEFAMLILVEIGQDASSRIPQDLFDVGQTMGLRITVGEQTSKPPEVKGLPYQLKTYSMDQPGIVARISQLLRTHGINIEDLTARQESAPFAGSPLFLTEMLLTVPSSVALSKLRSELELLGNELNCDVDLDPA